MFRNFKPTMQRQCMNCLYTVKSRRMPILTRRGKMPIGRQFIACLQVYKKQSPVGTIEHKGLPMANTYINILIHTVFSTKNRESWLSSSLRERLYPYMCGIAREIGLKVLCIGGTNNHIHFYCHWIQPLRLQRQFNLSKVGHQSGFTKHFQN